MSFQQYVKRSLSARINQVTNEVLNSPAQTRTGHQVFTSCPFTALAPPSFPSRPGLSMLIDRRSEGLLTVDNHVRRWTSKDIRNRCRRMSFGQYHATTPVMNDDANRPANNIRLGHASQ
jgi:hypothetical protein